MVLADKVLSSLYVASCLRCICRFMLSRLMVVIPHMSQLNTFGCFINMKSFLKMKIVKVPVLIPYRGKLRQGNISSGNIFAGKKGDDISKLLSDKNSSLLETSSLYPMD